MDVSLFDFDLPEDLIALRPAQPARQSRVCWSCRRTERSNTRMSATCRNICARAMCSSSTTRKVIPARLHGAARRAKADGDDRARRSAAQAPRRRIVISRFARPARETRRPAIDLHLGRIYGREVIARGEAGEVEIALRTDRVRRSTPQLPAKAKCRCRPILRGKRKTDAQRHDGLSDDLCRPAKAPSPRRRQACISRRSFWRGSRQRHSREQL